MRITTALRCALIALAAACGGGVTPPERDGGSPDGGRPSEDPGVRPTCEGLRNGEVTAREAVETLEAELRDQGFEPLVTTPTDVYVYGVDREGLADGDPAPLYVESEAALLARPEDDGARIFYERTPPAIDWSTEALLFYFHDEPFTDVALFWREDALLLTHTHLAGCVPPEDPPHPPRERLRRAVVLVPRVDEVSVRTEERRYALRHFPLEPGFERVPENPLFRRNAGNATIVRLDGILHIWVEGYSGATGFVFHGTSDDGVSWDFAWDDAHTTTFEGLHTFDHERKPSVVRGDGELLMFFEQPDGDARTRDLHRARSTDGLRWTDVRRVRMGCDLREAYVQRDGDRLHAWGHGRSLESVEHATSDDDGLTWTCATEPVLERGDSVDDIDGRGVHHPAVVRIGERWVMFYATAYGFRETHRVHLAYATSEDGTTFVPGGPVLAQTLEPGHWESGLGNLGRPVPIVRGDDVWLYYSAGEGGEPSIGLAIGRGWTPPDR